MLEYLSLKRLKAKEVMQQEVQFHFALMEVGKVLILNPNPLKLVQDTRLMEAFLLPQTVIKKEEAIHLTYPPMQKISMGRTLDAKVTVLTEAQPKKLTRI